MLLGVSRGRVARARLPGEVASPGLLLSRWAASSQIPENAHLGPFRPVRAGRPLGHRRCGGPAGRELPRGQAGSLGVHLHPSVAAPRIAEPFRPCWCLPLKLPASPHLHFPPPSGWAAVPTLGPCPSPQQPGLCHQAAWPVPPRPLAARARASLPNGAGRCLDIRLCLGQHPTGTAPLTGPPPAPLLLSSVLWVPPRPRVSGLQLWTMPRLSVSCPPQAPHAPACQAVLGPRGSALSPGFPGVRESPAGLRMTGGRRRAGTGRQWLSDLPANSARPMFLLQKPWHCLSPWVPSPRCLSPLLEVTAVSSSSLTSQARQLWNLPQPPQPPSLVPGQGLVEGAAWKPRAPRRPQHRPSVPQCWPVCLPPPQGASGPW